MGILSNIRLRLEENGKTQAELCESIGVNRRTFTSWNAGVSASYMKYLPQIAEYFNITVDELIADPRKKESDGPEMGTAAERDEMVKMLEELLPKMTQEEREMIWAQIKFLQQRKK